MIYIKFGYTNVTLFCFALINRLIRSCESLCIDRSNSRRNWTCSLLATIRQVMHGPPQFERVQLAMTFRESYGLFGVSSYHHRSEAAWRGGWAEASGKKKKELLIRQIYVLKTPERWHISMHGIVYEDSEILDWVKGSATPNSKLPKSIKAAIEILNYTEGVEVASPFWVNAMEVLENDTKRMQWLKMP